MTALAIAPTAGQGEPYEPGQEIVPGYRAIEHMRRGEDFDTYDAWSEERYCRCVIKTPRPDLAHHAGVSRRLRREGRLLLSFTHPHIVRAYDMVVPDGAPPVLVMETLSGATLGRLIDQASRRLAARDLAYLGQHLCSATRYMHDHGYLHLDLKPSNIIAEGGRARVIDLSLARHPGRCRGGIGTPSAMAPEQVRGGLLGPEADVWGIGLVLYEAASGVQPFDTGKRTTNERTPDTASRDEDCYPQLVEPAPSIRTLRRLPHELATVIDACLRPHPYQRPTMPELAATLAAATSTYGSGALRNRATPSRQV